MQLGPPAQPGPLPGDVAAAVRDGAARLGHRPAITQLLPDSRQEQSAASLAQWAAKGAHFFDLELGLGAGSRIRLDAPPGWPLAAVALAAWWAGIALDVGAFPDGAHDDGSVVRIVHGSRPAGRPPAGVEVFLLGDGMDGAPTISTAPGTAGTHGEAWTHAVQPFPDQPPPPGAAGDAGAVHHGRTSTTQAELLRLALDFDAVGTVGIDLGDDRGSTRDHTAEAGDRAVLDLALLCLRPLLRGSPTVVTRGVPRSVADPEKVRRWR